MRRLPAMWVSLRGMPSIHTSRRRLPAMGQFTSTVIHLIDACSTFVQEHGVTEKIYIKLYERSSLGATER